MKTKQILISVIVLTTLFVGLFARAPRAGQAAASAQTAVYPVGQGTNWALTFNDEFNGTALNRNIWRSDYANGGNGELQEYVNDDSHNNYVVQNGVLSIVARKESYNGRNYTSGIISSEGAFQQKYGYFEMRARVPKGKGLWPAFWMLAPGWVPEIDIMEILADVPTLTYMTYHYSGGQTQSTYSGPDFSAGYHTFGVDWEASAITFYVDGVARKTVTNTAIISSSAMWIVADLAVGGNWPGSPDSSTVFPANFDIDYIRVWQKSSTAGPTATPTKAATSVVSATPTQVSTAVTPAPTGNMISNASFETAGASPWYAPWSFRNDLGATFTQDTTTAANSTHASLKATLSTSNSSSPWVVAADQPNKTFSAGQSYTLTFWAKASITRPIRAVVQLQNSPYTEFTNQTANLTGSWTKYTYTFTAPTSTNAAMLNFNLASAAGSVWIDEVSLCTAGTNCASTAPAPTATQVYLPTVTSTPNPTLPPPTATPTTATTANLIKNASFEDAGVSPWYTPWSFRNDLGATFTQDTSTAANSTRASLKAYLPSSNSSSPWVVAVDQPNKSLTSGLSYTLTFWAKASASRSIRAVVQLQNSPYTELTNQGANLTSTWARYSFTFTPSVTTNAAMLNLNLASTTGTVWIDDVSLCRTGFVCQ